MKFTQLFVFSISILTSMASFADGSKFDLKDQVSDFYNRYHLSNDYVKLVDNQGEGFQGLYGVRNFRVVLKGVYYRGGANNEYNRDLRRKTMNPLEKDGLLNLCREGFTEAVYLYATNFKTAPKVVTCRTRTGADGKLVYEQINGLLGHNEHEQLKKIYDHITGTTPGPIYDHCWNGWHASGYIAAISLKQWCGFSNAQADSYWVKNTDGNEQGNADIRRKLRNFQPFSDLKISKEQRDLICPN